LIVPDVASLGLRVVDGRQLPEEYRQALKPGETICDAMGRARELPRYFYEIPSWDIAMKVQLSENFFLWEFIQVDVREAEVLRRFPRYVPCSITLLGVCLQRLRERVGTLIHISANGGYRSPGHKLSRHASPHSWATAVNVYRIGDTYLDTQREIEKYSLMAQETLPGVWTRPYGDQPGYAEDHLHLDIGYVTTVPRDAPGS
jgi:hypothetical protein